MITFKISFILAFSIVPKPELKKKEKKTDKKNKDENKKVKNDKKNKKNGNGKSETAPVLPKHVFEVDNPIGVAHIEYELIPNKYKYSIDVKCWGSIAKIFTSDGQITLKTMIKDNIAWVPVCVQHFFQQLSLDEVKNLRDHIIKFDVVNNNAKLGKLASVDKTKLFYTWASQASLNRFIEVYDHDPNLSDVKKENDPFGVIVDNIIEKCVGFSECDYASILLFLQNSDLIFEVINKHCAGVEIECKDFVLPCAPLQTSAKRVRISIDEKSIKPVKSKVSKDKVKSKGKKGEVSAIKPDSVAVSVPGEIFFTDNNWVIYKGENESDGVIKNVYVLISVERILSRAQKLLLDPLVIKIRKLSNVPVDALRELGITSLYTTYNIPYIADCTTIKKPVMKRMKFEESHIFFNEGVSKLKLIEFIQTKKLYVEIYGVRNLTPPEPNLQLFGNEPDDKNINKIRSLKKPDRNTFISSTSVLLAVCAYDISSIVQNIWDFKEKGQCHMPGLTLHQKYTDSKNALNYLNIRNVNEININLNYFKVKNLVSEETFVNFGTTLKVEVYLMAPQTASLIILRIPNTFKRFLFTLPTLELARTLLSSIIRNNEEILSTRRATSNEKELEFLDIITGFVIDNENNVTFFVEGLSTGFILSIENITITSEEIENGNFFFNTDTIFEKRLYTTFIRQGLNILTLRIPFYRILRDHRIYLEGNVPLPCMEALKKLFLLFYSTLFKSILQSNLLPKAEELLSLNLEWGVPLMVKQTELEF